MQRSNATSNTQDDRHRATRTRSSEHFLGDSGALIQRPDGESHLKGNSPLADPNPRACPLA
eukprot:10111732-Alexandrium_andersonii.AAC.1